MPIECAFLFTFRGNLSHSEITEWNCITKLMGVSYTYVQRFTIVYIHRQCCYTLRLEFLQSRTDCIVWDRIVGYGLPKCQTFLQLRKIKWVCECGNTLCIVLCIRFILYHSIDRRDIVKESYVGRNCELPLKVSYFSVSSSYYYDYCTVFKGKQKNWNLFFCNRFIILTIAIHLFCLYGAYILHCVTVWDASV